MSDVPQPLPPTKTLALKVWRWSQLSGMRFRRGASPPWRAVMASLGSELEPSAVWKV